MQPDQGIQLNPYVTLCKDSLRATSLCLYAGTDGITYYKIFEYYLRNIAEPGSTNNTWQIINNGSLTIAPTLTQLYTGADAASISNEENTIGTWQPYTQGVETITVDSPGAAGSAYSIKVSVSTGFGGMFPLSLGNSGNFLIKFTFKSLFCNRYLCLYIRRK